MQGRNAMEGEENRMQETILKYAKGMAPVGEGELPLLETLCRAAEAELAGKLRRGLKPEDCNGAFPLAAAWLARAGLCAGQGADDTPRSWSAGAVSVTGAVPAGERAASLREQAYRLMAPYVEDNRFFFQGVRG